MTRGKPFKLIVSFFLPVLAGNLFQQFYNMVDSIIVGQFVGELPLSAVGSTGSISFLIIGFVTGLCTGFSIPVSKYFGADDQKNMRRAIANAAYLCVIISVIITVASVLCAKPMLRAMNTPDDIFDDAYNYIVIIMAGLGATVFYNILSCILRAIGDSKTPLFFLVVSSIINIVFDLVFVLVFDAGVKGVAIATVLAQIISGLLCLIHINKHIFILHVQPDERKFDKGLSKELMLAGLPMALQFSVTAVGTIMLQSAINMLGTDIITVVTVSQKLHLIVSLPSEAIGIAMATYCSQNLGAKKIERISKGMRCALILSAIYFVLSWTIIHFFGQYMPHLFLNDSSAFVYEKIHEYLTFLSFMHPFLYLIYIYRNSLQGIGYSMHSMFAGVVELITRAGASLFIIPALGFTGVCISNPLAWVAADLFLIPMFYYQFRKLKKTARLSA